MSPNPELDLLVLGGGVIGLACVRAIHQKHPELRAAVLDAPTGAIPASRAAAGMLAPYAEFKEDGPLPRLARHSLHGFRSYLEDLTDESGADVTCVWSGTFVPGTPETDEEITERAKDPMLVAAGAHMVTGRDLHAREPRLSPDIERALWLPEGVVNPRELHEALRSAAMRRHIGWIDGVPVEAIPEGRRLAGFKLKSGKELRAKVILIATGAWSGEVARMTGVEFGMKPLKGQIARLEAPSDFLHHVIHHPDIYLAPRPGEGIVIGASMEDKGFDTTIDAEVIRGFVARAAALVPHAARLVVLETWAGFRPMTPDRLPVLGWTRKWENVMVASGHYRNGILLVPATAEAIAALYDDPAATGYEAFSPARLETASPG